MIIYENIYLRCQPSRLKLVSCINLAIWIINPIFYSNCAFRMIS